MKEDLTLVHRWREGDRAAGEELLRGYFAPISRFFRTKAGDRADELIQQTFMRCAEGLERFEGRSSFGTWLFGTARNVLFEHYRRIARDERIDFSVSTVEALDPSPSQVVARGDTRREVLEALRRIPVEQQMLLELYYWEGLPVSELAEVLEVPVGTVKGRLHAARNRIRGELGGADVFGDPPTKGDTAWNVGI